MDNQNIFHNYSTNISDPVCLSFKTDASVGRTLSPGSSLKPVAAPAAHSVMKGNTGAMLHDQDIATAANNAAAEQYLTPNYTVQSPYSTINVS